MRAILILVALAFSTSADAQVRVRGYYDSNGYWVAPHSRTYPDAYRWNNRSAWYPVQRYYRPWTEADYQRDQLRRQLLNQQADAQFQLSEPYLYRPMGMDQEW